MRLFRHMSLAFTLGLRVGRCADTRWRVVSHCWVGEFTSSRGWVFDHWFRVLSGDVVVRTLLAHWGYGVFGRVGIRVRKGVVVSSVCSADA